MFLVKVTAESGIPDRKSKGRESKRAGCGRKDKARRRRRRRTSTPPSASSSLSPFLQSNAEGGPPCALPLLFLSLPGLLLLFGSKLPSPVSSSMPASAMIEAQVPTFSLAPWASRRRPVDAIQSKKEEEKEESEAWKERGQTELGKGEEKRKTKLERTRRKKKT